MASLLTLGKGGLVFAAPWERLMPAWEALALPDAERQAGWNLVVWDASGWGARPPGPVAEIWLTAPGTILGDPRWRVAHYDDAPHTIVKYSP